MILDSSIEVLVSAHKSGGLKGYTTLVDEFYFSMFGEHVKECSCPNRWEDAFILAYSKYKKMKNQQEYTMRRGVIVKYGNKYYGYHNITDAIAKKVIKARPEDAEKFIKLTANGED